MSEQLRPRYFAGLRAERLRGGRGFAVVTEKAKKQAATPAKQLYVEYGN